MTDGSVCAAVAPEGRGVYLVPSGSLNFESMGDGTASLVVSSGGQSPREFGVSYGLVVDFEVMEEEFRLQWLFRPIANVNVGDDVVELRCAFPIFASDVLEEAIPVGLFADPSRHTFSVDEFVVNNEEDSSVYLRPSGVSSVLVTLVDSAGYRLVASSRTDAITSLQLPTNCDSLPAFTDASSRLTADGFIVPVSLSWLSCQLSDGALDGWLQFSFGDSIAALRYEIAGMTPDSAFRFEFNDLENI